MKIRSIAAMLVSSLLGVACMAPADAEHEVEDVDVQSAELVSVVGSGYAWVQASGAYGGGWSSRGAVTSSKIGPGTYTVDFAGQRSTNANAQVVAYGSSFAHCKLLTNAIGSSSTMWIVRCYNASGSLTDSAFNILTDHRTGSDYPRSAYLTRSSTNAVSDSWNSGGSANSVSVLSTGVYRVTTPGTVDNSSVHVTALGTDAARCKIGWWGTTTAEVRCFNASGAPANSGFSFARRRGALIDGQIGAHAWITGGRPSPAYTMTTGNCLQNPAPSLSVTAIGNDLLVTLPEATLRPGNAWSDTLPMVTAYGTNANTCQVQYWGMSGTTATARVRCFNSAGTQINASSTQLNVTLTSKYFPFC